eukprot:gene16960-biopygen2913
MFRRATTRIWIQRDQLPRKGPQKERVKSKIRKANRMRRGEWRVGGERDRKPKWGGNYADWRVTQGYPRKTRAQAISVEEAKQWREQGHQRAQPPNLFLWPQPKSAYGKRKKTKTEIQSSKTVWDGSTIVWTPDMVVHGWGPGKCTALDDLSVTLTDLVSSK